jgi:hypothetical protein
MFSLVSARYERAIACKRGRGGSAPLSRTEIPTNAGHSRASPADSAPTRNAIGTQILCAAIARAHEANSSAPRHVTPKRRERDPARDQGEPEQDHVVREHRRGGSGGGRSIDDQGPDQPDVDAAYPPGIGRSPPSWPIR